MAHTSTLSIMDPALVDHPHPDPEGERESKRLRYDDGSTAVNLDPAIQIQHDVVDDVTSPAGSDALSHGFSPRRGFTYKREGEPPRNAEGKMICTVEDACAGIVFDRKCEWGKHMDKHDRPYRCERPECTKLQGFTYSGGLLRHQREVHKMHGGTGKQLFCPELTCKRHTGSGFTRKENLQEHMRRVHRRTSTGIADTDNAVMAQKVLEENERMPSTEHEIHEEPAFRQLIEATNSLNGGANAPVASMISKNRDDGQVDFGTTNGHLIDPSIDETTRLRLEIESRDAKIEALERQNQEMGDRIFRLEEQMLHMTTPGATA